MSRFLFVTLPLPGHATTIAAVASALTARGHEVVWAGSESFLRPHVGPDARIHPIPLRAHRGQAQRGLAAAATRWDGYIVPHAKTTIKGIEAAVAEFAPDALAVDQHAVAGAVVAHGHGLPWATLATSTMELTRPLRTMPRVEAFIGERLAAIWTMGGRPGSPPYDLRFSPYLVIGFTGAALTGQDDLPDNTVLVGPAFGPRPPDPDFPWDWIDPGRQLVLITVGTLNLDHAGVFYQRAIEALTPLGDRLQAIILAAEGTIDEVPEHFLVRRRAPVLDLMSRLDAVVSHGGMGTVGEALAHGVPLVVVPIKDDQPVNARQVVAAGAGVRLSFDHVRPDALRAAVLAMLDDPTYRAAAGRIGASFAAAGGADAAAKHLESLTARP